MGDHIRNILLECTAFDWDRHNSTKNENKHNVTSFECEQIFLNIPLILAEDTSHSLIEKRFYALGCTNESRPLFIVFTVRKRKIRIISARDMNLKERKEYAYFKENPEI